MFHSFLSSKHNAFQINTALLLLRVAAGIWMAFHGYQKLTGFTTIEPQFMEFLGLSKSFSLGLTIFSELLCSLLLVAGLFTRIALIPLIVTMLVAVFMAHGGDLFGEGEHAFLYLAIYLALLISGPGKYSADEWFYGNK